MCAKKMDLAESDFPEDARPPIITELNAATFPVLVINIYGQAPERGLNRIARNLQEELETISGVLEANIQGEREEVLEIIVDPIKLETYNLSYQDVLASVSANNRLIPAGRIAMEEGRFAVKVPGLLKTAEDAFNLPVIESGDAVVTLSDVADIRRTFKDRDVYAQFNGDPSVSIEIVKRTGANILDTVEEVKTALARAEAEWPTTVRASVTSDMSDVISNQLGTTSILHHNGGSPGDDHCGRRSGAPIRRACRNSDPRFIFDGVFAAGCVRLHDQYDGHFAWSAW